MTGPGPASSPAGLFLPHWHAMVRARDVALIADWVREDAVIASPMFWSPRGPRAYVLAILGAVTAAFEDFTYTKEWVDGRTLLLEFTARVGDRRLKGIDRIELDDAGRMSEIEVLIRPMNALQALGAQVMARLVPAP